MLSEMECKSQHTASSLFKVGDGTVAPNSASTDNNVDDNTNSRKKISSPGRRFSSFRERMASSKFVGHLRQKLFKRSREETSCSYHGSGSGVPTLLNAARAKLNVLTTGNENTHEGNDVALRLGCVQDNDESEDSVAADRGGLMSNIGCAEKRRRKDGEKYFGLDISEHSSLPRFSASQLLAVDDGNQKSQQHTQPKSSLPVGGNASILSCVVNLLNTVAGAGMLGLPGAYAGSGFLVGSSLLGIASFFSAMGLHLLAKSAITARQRQQDNGQSSFYTVASAALPEFTMFIDGAVALKCFGVATGYLITVGDCMVDSFHYILRNFMGPNHPLESILVDRHFWVLTGLMLALPICFYKTLNALKFTSTLSLMFIYALMVGIVLYAEGVFDPCLGFKERHSHSHTGGNHTQLYENATELYGGSELDAEYIARVADAQDEEVCQGNTVLFTTFQSTIKNLAIFVFSFTCHQNVFAIVNEIKDRTQARVDTVIVTAIGSALILYILVAIEGYRTFGNEVKGDILLNYPQTALVTMMRIAIAIMVILSYPLQLDPSRRCLTSLIYSLCPGANGACDDADAEGMRQALSHPSPRSKESVVNGLETIGSEPAAVTINGNVIHDTPLTNAAHGVEGCCKSNGFSGNFDMEEATGGEDAVLLKQVTKEFLFNGITCVFLVLTFLIAMIVSDLGIVLGVIGATGSTMVSYILPGAIYVKLHPKPHVLKYVAYVQLSLGIIIIPTALYFVVFKNASA